MGNSNSSEVRTRDLGSSEVTTGTSLVETLDPSVVMAAENAPITTREVLKLASLGINHQFMTSRYVTMESEKYICVRETSPRNNVVIIDMRKPTQPLRKSITADSALMNPVTPIIALKGEIQETTRDNLQIFNIETKTEVKSYQMTEVVFWKWITPKILGLVTSTTVYHWSIEGDSRPMKIFDRTASLANNQIINYMCDTTEKWFVLIGIAYDPSEGPQFVKGSMQIFSVDERRSQVLEAHAASFATFTVEGSEDPLTLICIASKIKLAGQVTSKLRVIELGAQPGKPGFYTKKVDMLFPPNCQDDFPMAMQVSQKYGLIYVITMMGLLFVYDLETAQSIYSNRISPDPIFLITEATTSGGFYAINRKGHVLLANVNDATIVPFVCQLNKEKLAMSLAIRANLPGAENLFTQRFEELLRQTKYKEAAELAAESPHGILRTPAIFAKLKSGTVRAGQLLYFGTLITKVKLNAFESLELCRLVLKENRKDLLEHWLDEDKLECTKALGDLVKTVDTDMARMIHERSNFDGAKNLTEVAESSSHVVKFTNFSLSEIIEATNNFNESLKIGIGGSGIVYKGFLRYMIVAIKKLHPNSSQTDRLFYKEVDILTKVKHPNLVNLIGASLEARAVVYEFLPNGSLDDFLTNRNSSSQTLSWQIRIRVACEICSALIFLHSVKPHSIAHGDLKLANVLLDSNFVTKLSDFGISRELTTTNATMSSVHITKTPNGTLAYIDPEYIQTCELTPQSDVYSFGIMLLQFVTGKDPWGIRIKVETSMNIRGLNELVDNSAGWPTEMAYELASLGLECCHSERKKRPGLVEKVWPSLESMKSIADYT